MKNILSVSPPRLGGLDMLIPIFLEMKLHSDVFIEVVLPNYQLMDQLKRDSYLKYKLESTVDKITVIESNFKLKDAVYNVRVLTNLWRISLLFCRVLLYQAGPVLMHASSLNSRFINSLNRIIHYKDGYTIGHFKLMNVDFSVVPAEKEIVETLYGDYFAVFNMDNVSGWDFESKKKCIPIGYPRIYRSWIENLRNDSKRFRSEKPWFPGQFGEDPFALIYLPSTLKNVFDEEELEDWLVEVITCLRKKYCEDLIVIKPHPMQKMKNVIKVIDKLLDPQCVISFVQPGLLAAQAKIVISHHSTTIIDAMAMNVPVIHHQVFTEHWLKRHPNGIAQLEFGQIRTSNMIELNMELENIEEKKNIHSNLIENVKHKECVKNLFNKISLPPLS